MPLRISLLKIKSKRDVKQSFGNEFFTPGALG